MHLRVRKPDQLHHDPRFKVVDSNTTYLLLCGIMTAAHAPRNMPRVPRPVGGLEAKRATGGNKPGREVHKTKLHDAATT